MNLEKRIELLAQATNGIKKHEWTKLKTAIDMAFASEVAKVQLNDSDLRTRLKRNI